MRKTLVGLAAAAAIAIPLVASPAANAAVTYDSTCTPVAAQAASTKTVYKYSPVKNGSGPTQWADDDDAPGTARTFVVKGKDVAYTRDGTKTDTVSVAAIEGTTCGIKLSDPSGTRVNLPDVFDIEHTGDPAGTYWSTQVAVTVTNDTANAQEFRVRYADVQDGDRVWVERAIFTDGQPGNVVPAGASRVMVFDVWHNVVSDADVPDDLTLDFGFELVATGTRVSLPDVFDIKHTEYSEGTYWSTQVEVLVNNPTDTDQEFNARYVDVQDGDRVWIERAIFTDGQPNNVVPANSSRPMVFDVWYNVPSDTSDVPDDLTMDYIFEIH